MTRSCSNEHTYEPEDTKGRRNEVVSSKYVAGTKIVMVYHGNYHYFGTGKVNGEFKPIEKSKVLEERQKEKCTDRGLKRIIQLQIAEVKGKAILTREQTRSRQARWGPTVRLLAVSQTSTVGCIKKFKWK